MSNDRMERKTRKDTLRHVQKALARAEIGPVVDRVEMVEMVEIVEKVEELESIEGS